MKKFLILTAVSSFFTILFSSSFAVAGLLFPYNRLALKDLDQMNKLIREKIQESRKAKGEQIVPLKEALQAVYSRPNEDFMIDKVINPLRNELDEHDGYELSIRALMKEALGALKNPKAFGAVPQVTYLIFLENLVADYKPKARDPFEAEMLEKIRDAKIIPTKEAINERRLRMMKETLSPSDIAGNVLKEIAEQDKKKKEAAAAKPTKESGSELEK